jgi:hypothetical protein
MLGLDLTFAYYGVEHLIWLIPLWVYGGRYTIRGLMKRVRSHL